MFSKVKYVAKSMPKKDVLIFLMNKSFAESPTISEQSKQNNADKKKKPILGIDNLEVKIIDINVEEMMDSDFLGIYNRRARQLINDKKPILGIDNHKVKVMDINGDYLRNSNFWGNYNPKAGQSIIDAIDQIEKSMLSRVSLENKEIAKFKFQKAVAEAMKQMMHR